MGASLTHDLRAYDTSFAGQLIGLYGGSFNPAHKGHLHVSDYAFQTLGLDALWWLVSPNNPLKETSTLAPMDQRVAHAKELAADPRITITSIESQLGSNYSFDTISKLKNIHKDSRFIWMIGADNLMNFHAWKNWRAIFTLVPIAVFARPGYDEDALAAPAAAEFKDKRLSEHEAQKLGDTTPPCWVYLNMPHHEASATALRTRASNNWEKATQLAKVGTFSQSSLLNKQQRKDKE